MYDIKDLPPAKVVDFIEDNNLALNKTFPYFMPEDINENFNMGEEYSLSFESNSTNSDEVTDSSVFPRLRFEHVKDRQLEMFYNKNQISLKSHQNRSKESQVLKRSFEITTTVNMLL